MQERMNFKNAFKIKIGWSLTERTVERSVRKNLRYSKIILYVIASDETPILV